MKRVNRSYPPEFRKAAVQQVVDGGRNVPTVARSLEMSAETLANCVLRAQGGAAGQGVVPRADERTGSRADAIAARGRQAADGERDPKRSGGVLCQGVDVKYAWIEAHLDSYPVRPMCELLGVSPSGFYAARSRVPSAHAVEQAQIVTEIRRAQTRHRGRYGRRRMTTEVRAVLGRPVNEKRIGRLMRLHDLSSRQRRRFRVVTTDSKHAHPVAPNVLERDFEATAPNQKWLADRTYVPTDEGWLYLALVMDLFSRKLVGWAMSDTMPQELTLAALRVALGWRDPPPGLVHHSDRGSQYAAGDYRKVLQARGITVSMSRKGNCWENQRSAVSRAERREGEARHNALMESGHGTVQVECVHGEHFRTRAEARQALVEYIGYYNTERRHSSLGNLSPAVFERRWQGAALPTRAGGGPLQ